MALGDLTVSVTSGIQGRPFKSKINGLTTGRVEVLADGTPGAGFYISNGFLQSEGLPPALSPVTAVLREYEPGATPSVKDTRIAITSYSEGDLATQAASEIAGGRSLTRYSVGGAAQGDGSIAYQLFAQDDLGATVVADVTGGGGEPDGPFALSMLPSGSVLDYDANEGITLDTGKVAQWDAVIGTGSFTPTIATSPANYTASGGPADSAYLRGYTTGDGSRMTSDEALVNHWADFLVIERQNVDQNAVASLKRILNTGRLSDGLAVHILLQRAVTDPSQDKIYVSQLGGNGPTERPGFGKNTGWHLFTHLFDNLNTQYSGVDASLGTGLPPGGSTTTTTTSILGYASADRSALVNMARRLRLDLELIPGGGEQLANIWLIEGLLAWQYGLSLPSGHKYKDRAPLASDYTGINHNIQMWGNSLGLGTAGQFSGVINANSRGMTWSHDCIGGITSTAIKGNFDANNDQPAGTSSGLSEAEVRSKVHVFGEMFQNDSGASISPATGQANIASMIADVESAQGVTAGNGRIVLWAKWQGNGGSGDTVPLLADDSFNTYLATTYPNYFLDVGRELALMAAPDGAYPDAEAYARRAIPAALRAADIIHLNTTGYTEAAALVKNRIEERGWLLPLS